MNLMVVEVLFLQKFLFLLFQFCKLLIIKLVERGGFTYASFLCVGFASERTEVAGFSPARRGLNKLLSSLTFILRIKLAERGGFWVVPIRSGLLVSSPALAGSSERTQGFVQTPKEEKPAVTLWIWIEI